MSVNDRKAITICARVNYIEQCPLKPKVHCTVEIMAFCSYCGMKHDSHGI